MICWYWHRNRKILLSSQTLRTSWRQNVLSFQTSSFSSFRTAVGCKRLPPCPNGQGHTVHSCSQNWRTQGHSWNMGVTCGRDLSYTKGVFKKASRWGQPCDWCRALPAEPWWRASKVKERTVACRDCEHVSVCGWVMQTEKVLKRQGCVSSW